jgi:hypothetical protein
LEGEIMEVTTLDYLGSLGMNSARVRLSELVRVRSLEHLLAKAGMQVA